MDTEFSRYHCSAEWHLAQLKRTPFAGILYPFALRIAKSGRFHGSVEGLAEYFGVSRWKVQRAVESLLNLEFFELIAREPFKPSSYRVHSHKDWAPEHPDRCTVKESFPWSGEEGDQLGMALWNASGGKVRYQKYQLQALRKTGRPDDQIVAAFERIVTAEEKRRQAKNWHGRWRAVPSRFLRWLTGRLNQSELNALGLQPFCISSEPVASVQSNLRRMVAGSLDAPHAA